MRKSTRVARRNLLPTAHISEVHFELWNRTDMARMRKFLSLFCFICSTFCIAGCEQSGALNLARQIGIENLRTDLNALNAKPEGQHAVVPQELWPESVKRFRPVALRHEGEFGMLIVLSRSERRESGLYLPFDPNFKPSSGSGEGYELLASGLYWSEVKNRARLRCIPGRAPQNCD